MMTRRELFSRLAAVPFAPLALAAMPAPSMTVPVKRELTPRVSENMARAITKLVAQQCLPILMNNLAIGNLVNRRYDATVANGGDIVNIPLPPTLCSDHYAGPWPMKTGTRGEMLEFERAHSNPPLGDAQIVLNKHMEASFQVPDPIRALALDPAYLSMLIYPAAIALAEGIEIHLVEAGRRLPQQRFCFQWPPPASSGAWPEHYKFTLMEACLDDADTILFRARVPEAAQKYLVLSASAYAEVRKQPRFSETSGPLGIEGRFKNFLVYRSRLIGTTMRDTFGYYFPVEGECGIAFTKDALALIGRRPPIEDYVSPGTGRGCMVFDGRGCMVEYAEASDFGARVTLCYNPASFAQQFNIDMLYGVGVLRRNFGVQVNA